MRPTPTVWLRGKPHVLIVLIAWWLYGIPSRGGKRNSRKVSDRDFSTRKMAGKERSVARVRICVITTRVINRSTGLLGRVWIV